MRIAVLGAGAWGTAMAVHLASRASARPQVVLWARDGVQAQAIAGHRENRRYLAGCPLPESIHVTAELSDARDADLLLAATPVAALLPLADALTSAGCRAPLAWLSKGFVGGAADPMLAHQALAPRWVAPVGVVSGPSFADEVARGLPTALAVAATDGGLAATIAAALRGDTLRAYESDDIAGV